MDLDAVSSFAQPASADADAEGIARPRFSVFIPIYNNAEWLSGAVDSALAQTYPASEIVVGDNASEDDLASIVGRYSDPRVKYCRFDRHVPIFENFNRTEALCSEPWVVLLCADDRLHPRYLESIADSIKRAEGEGGRAVAMVVTGSKPVGPDGTPKDVEYFGYHGVIDLPAGRYDASSWMRALAEPGAMPWESGAVSRRCVQEMGSFYRTDQPSMSADLELALRVAAFGDVIYVPEPLFEVTTWPASHTHGRHARNLRANEPLTPHAAAWRSALAAHARVRAIARSERSAVGAAIARSYLRRAAAHRYRPGGHGRSGALGDVLKAGRYSRRTLFEPANLVLAAAVVVAPARLLVAWRDFTLARRARASEGRAA